MNSVERIICVGIGVAGGVFGFTAKRFSLGGWGSGHTAMTIPKWLGRLICLIWALTFIYWGLNRSSHSNPFLPALGFILGMICLYYAYQGAPASDGLHLTRVETRKIAWHQRAIFLLVGLVFVGSCAYAVWSSLR
jgi:hypothetical protein